jgi:tetratricopeptide (TPR) repeat protein
MHSYGVSDVEKLLRLPRSTIRALIAAGFVTPARGSRNAWQFSFQDLIVLRTAQALAAANIPQRRIVRALKDLRSRLPDEMPLSGLSIGAVADEVVVREGGMRWAAESGQYLLAFEGDPDAGSLRVIEPAPAHAAVRAEAVDDDALERRDSAAALRAYDAAIAADPERVDARINKGRLLHELGRYEEAVRTYLDALQSGVHDALLHYNLGVLLDDLDRKPQAQKAYEAALSLDPRMADAHYNLALLCEELDQPREAIRHMAQYRRLVAGG